MCQFLLLNGGYNHTATLRLQAKTGLSFIKCSPYQRIDVQVIHSWEIDWHQLWQDPDRGTHRSV